MTLEANHWTYHEIKHDDPGSQAFYHKTPTQYIEVGWHDNYAGGEPIMTRKNTITTDANEFETELMRLEEEWEYDAHSAPPVKYTAKTWGVLYLPGQGFKKHLLETIEEDYYPYTSFQEGHNNLSRVKRTSGWIIYDQHVERWEMSEEAKAKLRKKGIEPPEGIPIALTLVADSARNWREAVDEAGIIEESDTPQIAQWMEAHTTEVEYVLEEPDKFCKTGTKKIHYRAGPPELLGPSYEKKEKFKYSLPVPIDPPTLTGGPMGDSGNRLEIKGGGATFGKTRIRVERYKIMRRTVSEPSRSSSDDPFDLYDTAPTAEDKYQIIGTDSTTDTGGAPASPVPAPGSYSEPGDSSETDSDGWTVIAELDNEIEGVEDEGHASTVDADVVSGAVYEYVGVALIGNDQSDETQPVQITYNGTTTGSGIVARVRQDTLAESVEVDVVAPIDPELQDYDYGETVIFDVPADLECGEEWSFDIGGEDLTGEDYAAALGEEIARRQMAKNNRSRMDADLVVTLPLLTLERGQLIKPAAVEWAAINAGQDLIISSSTESNEWILDGWELNASRNTSGELSGVGITSLKLMEP